MDEGHVILLDLSGGEIVLAARLSNGTRSTSYMHYALKSPNALGRYFQDRKISTSVAWPNRAQLPVFASDTSIEVVWRDCTLVSGIIQLRGRPTCGHYRAMMQFEQHARKFEQSIRRACMFFFCSDPVCFSLALLPIAMETEADSYASFDFLASYVLGSQRGTKSSRKTEEDDRGPNGTNQIRKGAEGKDMELALIEGQGGRRGSRRRQKSDKAWSDDWDDSSDMKELRQAPQCYSTSSLA